MWYHNHMSIWLYLIAGFVGAIFGSFAGAQVLRLRAEQLIEDQAEGFKVDKAELAHLKPVSQSSFLADRSRCLSCSRELRWFDMIPIVSWLVLRGRCRSCHKFIGWSEILLEVSLAVLFVLSVYLWPMPLDSAFEIGKLAIWLSALVLLAVMFVYDKRWSILPDKVNLPFIALGVVFFVLNIAQTSNPIAMMGELVGSITILSLLYFILHKVSNGEWVGLGDVKLGLGMAFFLADWRLAFIALFASNLVGTLLVLPGLLRQTIKRQAKVPFGPLMIVGFLIAWFFGEAIVGWYQSLLFI